MNSPTLRQTLIEIAKSISDREDRSNALTDIAVQLTGEGDIQGALDLLEEIGSATSFTFSSVLEQLADVLFVPEERSEKMIQQLERIIENVPVYSSRGRDDERKIGLFVKLGNKYDELAIKGKADSNYKKAWELSGKAEQPAVTRLKYFVPLMREKGITFPVSRDKIIEEARRIGELEIAGDRLSDSPRILIAVAREYAFSRDYEKAEEIAQYINDRLDYPRDHYDRIYGDIIESAALHGDNEKIGYAASKMTHYITDHFEEAAMSLVKKGAYQRAMELANFAMRQGYAGISTQLRIDREILEQDKAQIEMVRESLERAIAKGMDAFALDQMIDIIAEYPHLDPDGQFTLEILQSAFERNRSIVAHHGHRVILRKLREIIMARVKDVKPSLRRIGEVYGEVSHILPTPDRNAQSSSLTPQEARAMIKGKLATEHHHLINDTHVQLAQGYERNFRGVYHPGPPEGIEIARGEKPDQSSSPAITTMEEGRKTKDEVGGIDMNIIDLNRQGAGVDIQFDPVELQEIIDAGIDGFAPVIINITPLPSILPLLGLDPAIKEEPLELSASRG